MYKGIRLGHRTGRTVAEDKGTDPTRFRPSAAPAQPSVAVAPELPMSPAGGGGPAVPPVPFVTRKG